MKTYPNSDPRFDVEEFTRLEHCVAGKLCEGKLGFVIQIAETYDGNNCKRRWDNFPAYDFA